MKIHYTVYKTTNKINNRIYYGVHQTTNPIDSYLGSGVELQVDIKKYGKINFKKEVLKTLNTIEEMFEYEAEIVTEDVVKDEMTYNLTLGGYGGLSFAGKKSVWVQKQRGTRKEGFTKEEQEKAHKAWRYLYDNDLEFRKKHEENTRKASKLSNTPEAKKKRKKTFKEIDHQQGDRNSQYGTMWITNSISSKKIKNNLLIPNGWKKGRILNKG